LPTIIAELGNVERLSWVVTSCLLSQTITEAIATVFRVAAVVAAAGCVLTWFIPARPLRETVAAATSSVGKEAGDAFSMPGTTDSAIELLRGVAILADRDAQRAYLKSIADRAGLELMPVSAWLLLRLGEDPALTPEAIAREHQIPAARTEEGLAELKTRGYIVNTRSGPPVALTDAGCVAYDRLASARRERPGASSSEWPEAQRQQVVAILQRLARDLVPPRAA
jgi:hypothetical protein